MQGKIHTESKEKKTKNKTTANHSVAGKLTHSEKSIPPVLCICICCSTGNRLPPNPGSLKSCPGNGIMLGCGCGDMCWCW